MERGIIALDIDGTVTGPDHQIPEGLCDYLRGLTEASWDIIFLSGRTFSFGYEILKELDFSYHFSAYNGATTLKMPERTVVRSHLADADLVAPLAKACAGEEIDPIVHTGVESGDRAFWRPQKFDEASRAYLEERKTKTTEPWIEVESFSELDITHFAYAKVFGRREALERIAAKMKDHPVAIDIIQDPLRRTHAVMVLTDSAATKGGALRDFREMHQDGIPAIAAGDDYNDVGMLDEADIAIVMASAPRDVIKLADITAKSLSEALDEAIARTTA